MDLSVWPDEVEREHFSSLSPFFFFFPFVLEEAFITEVMYMLITSA